MDKRNSIKKMLEKYFGKYDDDTTDVSPQVKHNRFKENLGGFNGVVENISLYHFIGVKVYPPLGFDPWPDNDPLELEKVKYLYDFCQEKRIPIVTHCSHGGFCVLKDSKRRLFTDPARWGKVLENYNDLILDFAHFGGDADKDQTEGWMDKIIDLILSHKNVYADISCICFTDKHYSRLNASFEKMRFKNEEQKNKLMQRIMFGSDFMINLLWADSYKSYLENFFATSFFKGEKKAFCSVNPSRFLFGDTNTAQVKILHLVTGKKKPSPV
jgi:predicted TIM-barrel fold metal-dependent hydrolase